eukprot:COSAG01_NODE_4357_length_5106_cov_67.646295_2_plen_164_part_00
MWSLAQWFAWMCTSMPRGLRRTCFVDVVRRYKHRHARVRVDAGLYEPRGDRGRHYEQGGCRGTTTTVPYTNRRTESFIRFMLRMSPCCCCRRSHMGSRAHEATLHEPLAWTGSYVHSSYFSHVLRHQIFPAEIFTRIISWSRADNSCTTTSCTSTFSRNSRKE